MLAVMNFTALMGVSAAIYSRTVIEMAAIYIKIRCSKCVTRGIRTFEDEGYVSDRSLYERQIRYWEKTCKEVK